MITNKALDEILASLRLTLIAELMKNLRNLGVKFNQRVSLKIEVSVKGEDGKELSSSIKFETHH